MKVLIIVCLLALFATTEVAASCNCIGCTCEGSACPDSISAYTSKAIYQGSCPFSNQIVQISYRWQATDTSTLESYVFDRSNYQKYVNGQSYALYTGASQTESGITCFNTATYTLENTNEVYVVLKCNNFFSSCPVRYDITASCITANNPSSSSTPNPISSSTRNPSPSSTRNPSSSSSPVRLCAGSQCCECSCCLGNFCSPTYIGAIAMSSASECNNNACALAYGSSCPSSGTAGSSSARFITANNPSASSSSTPNPGSSTSSDTIQGQLNGVLLFVLVVLSLLLN
eukprot:c21514_g1_i3.p1 GENE.c21514_g1_i3~~c21514_g1_i3.p1  ORF type:complete len:302 (-),score=43.24 c21514_g1_i3:53-913(-)